MCESVCVCVCECECVSVSVCVCEWAYHDIYPLYKLGSFLI